MPFLQLQATNLIIIIFCLLLSAFFSAAETAITSLGTLKVKHILNSKDKSAGALRLWLLYPGRIITTILVFNNAVNILASSMITKISFEYFSNAAIGIATGVTTALVLIFGEIIPKSFAKTHSEYFALFAIKIVVVFYYVSYPIIRLLSGFADSLIKFISHGEKNSPLITEEEIEFMVSEGEKAGVIKDLKKDIISSAFDLDETRVKEVMTPRTDLTAISKDQTIKQALHIFINTGHSRIPVFGTDIDHIVGILLAKDLLHLQQTETNSNKLKVCDFMRSPVFAPESKSIMSAFKDMKMARSHLAIIIDEYGGTAGIVTMEDILEEIVGEIQDEFDSEQLKIVKISTGKFQVSGAINIIDFLEYFKLTTDDIGGKDEIEHVETLSGLITQISEQLPKTGQTVLVGPFKMEVLEVSRRRIKSVSVEQKQVKKVS